jgi:hypothetical protein
LFLPDSLGNLRIRYSIALLGKRILALFGCSEIAVESGLDGLKVQLLTGCCLHPCLQVHNFPTIFYPPLFLKDLNNVCKSHFRCDKRR